jgi:hypothetical protein
MGGLTLLMLALAVLNIFRFLPDNLSEIIRIIFRPTFMVVAPITVVIGAVNLFIKPVSLFITLTALLAAWYAFLMTDYGLFFLIQIIAHTLKASDFGWVKV